MTVRRPPARATSRNALAPVLRDVCAVVFDTDGVITDSARVRAAAWKTVFDACLHARPTHDPDRRRRLDVGHDCPRNASASASRSDDGEAARPGRPGEPRPGLFLVAGHCGGVALVISVERPVGPRAGGGVLRHVPDIVVPDRAEPVAQGASK
ncbi:hypothetical protein ABZT06_20580 [Streptomyces sp. NPDC005483]|uniref:hypothetical protein n=1 Tax=Streptomyces sp. NPDC005483 TaxID=3154882 RepID=UPI0033A7C731